MLRSRRGSKLCFSPLFDFCLNLFIISTESDTIIEPNYLYKCSPAQTISSYSCQQLPRNSWIASNKNSGRDRRATPLLATQGLHAQAVKNGSLRYSQLGFDLLRRYLEIGRPDCARHLFDEFRCRNVRSWTILIAAFANAGLFGMAVDLFSRMRSEGVAPNRFTLSSVFKCYAGVNELNAGKEVHGWILRNGIELDVVLNNSIAGFYVKSGAFDYGRRVFEEMDGRDSVSWNIMIDGCLQTGQVGKSLELFGAMPSRDTASWNTIISGQMRNGHDREALKLLYQMAEIGAKFNEVTLAVALALAATLALLRIGRQIHALLLRVGFESDAFVKSSLVDMYCKCGKIDSASILFESIRSYSHEFQRHEFNKDAEKERSIIWSSMIDGHILNGRSEDAFELFREMLQRGIVVGPVTFTSIASSCGDCGMLERGRQIHALLEKLGIEDDVILGSSMVDMYGKCGYVEDALAVFLRTTTRNVILWTSIIIGCASNGRGREAIRLFEKMLNENIKPNEISFVGVLSACSHAGLVEEGCKYFNLMKQEYGILPGVEHFTCMMDLFGRAGRLHEAKEFIFENDISNLSAVWRSLLSACRSHKNMEMGKWASDQLVKLEPFNDEPYILLSNLCAADERWEKAANVRKLMRDRGLRKNPGQSWILSKNENS